MTTPLHGRWTVTHSDRAAITAGPRPAWIQFGDHELRAHAGCNQMWASVTATATQLTCTGVCTTLMACEDASMRAEYALSQFLSEATLEYQVHGDVLVLRRHGESLQLQRTEIPVEQRDDA